ncbi:Protein N-acetyltransferase, RimJ/RimL family [Granulicella rosea]|uniref:Protein N-acetyltransferase, RimJ/RimL family n=1 Tax=Granulicella rosea TaxID=474952 RepID=A0A239DD67_9BACT|nr:GNAT family protein [Granulicella rosea]SNS30280.1 Protein N-acetyltransferase, RimJ/RimL family [Granulicella rosea]
MNRYQPSPGAVEFKPVTLTGDLVRLEPLTLDHHDDLVAAVKDGELWKLWFTFPPEPENVRGEIERRLGLQAAGSMIPFAVIDLGSGRAVGMTTYMNIQSAHRRVEIGSTWYAKSVQRTGINTEAKLLLLTHAFEALDCIAVEFQVHSMNQPSRRAVERLGAKLDGVIRNHSFTRNGALRDMCVYSILPSEWPTVKANLQWLLTKPR